MNIFLNLKATLFLLIIFFANGNISTAFAIDSNEATLTLEESKQLREDVQYLLSDKETIDYEDPKLNKILNKYADKYQLFKVYKDFIEFDKSNVISDNQQNSNIQKKLNDFLGKMSHNIIAQDGLDVALQEDLDYAYYNGYKYIKIPLWLAVKYPHVVNNYGFYVLSVNSKNSIRQLPEFQNFMDNFSKIHLGYWSPTHGNQKINSYLMTRYFVNVISFNPMNYITHDYTEKGNAKKSLKENIIYAEQESFSSIEHRLKYEKFLESLHKFSNALSQYYKTNYDLSEYADKSDIIISKYVLEHIKQDSVSTRKETCNSDYYDPIFVNFIILFGTDKINYLKPFIKDLGIKSKSEILRHAVLINAEIDFIKWLLDNGADPNYAFRKFKYEYPLMVSFRNIELMKLLLASGAEVNSSNIIGETALFYAIKFNNIEAIKLLIDNGANINAKTNPKIISLNNSDFINTPLVYARRYASQEVINLLIHHGAENGPADPEEIKKWIAEGPLDL